MSGITTHVLDLALGMPARGVPVKLELHAEGGWVMLAERVTDDDGRVRDLISAGTRLTAGQFRLTFGTGAYARALGGTTFYPEIPVTFEIHDPDQSYHVPLLLSPYGYSTYRGT